MVDQIRIILLSLLIPLNSYFLYFLLKIQFFLLVAIISGLILILFLLAKYFHTTLLKGEIHLPSILNKDIIAKFIRMNKKSIIWTSVGVIIASMILTQAILLPLNLKHQAFISYQDNHNNIAWTHQKVVDIDEYSDQNFKEWAINSENGINDVASQLKLQVPTINSFVNFFVEIIGDYPFDSNKDRIGVYTAEMDPIFSKILADGKFYSMFNNTKITQEKSYLLLKPEDQNEMDEFQSMIEILAQNRSVDIIAGLNFNNQNNTSLPIYASFKHEISDILVLDLETWIKWGNEINWIKQAHQQDGLFITPSNVWDIYQNITTFANLNNINPFVKTRLQYISTSYINIPKRTDLTVAQLKSKLVQSKNLFLSTLSSSQVESPLINTIESFQKEFPNIDLVFYLISTPLIGIALFIGYYSMSLFRDERKKGIKLMRKKGTRNSQIIIAVLGETLVIGLLGTALGFFLSIPSFWVLMSTLHKINLIEFPFEGSFTLTEMIGIIVAGIIFVFDLKVSNMLDEVRMGFDTNETQTSQVSNSITNKIDLFGFLFIILYFIITSQIVISSNLDLLLSTFITPYLLILLIILLPVILGKYSKPILDPISTFLNKLEFQKDHLPLKFLTEYSGTSLKYLAILVTLFLLLISTLSIPGNYSNWTEERASYNLGSDIYLEYTEADTTNTYVSALRSETYWTPQVEKENPFFPVPQNEITGVSEIYIYELEVNIQIGTFIFKILGVNPNSFVQAAYWDKKYDPRDLEKIINGLTENKLIVHGPTLQALGLEPGNTFILGGPQNQSAFRIATTIEYFPNLIGNDITPNPDEIDSIEKIPVLASLEVVDRIHQLDISTPKVEGGIYVKVENPENIGQVSRFLREQYQNNLWVKVVSIFDLQSNYMNLSISQSILTIAYTTFGVVFLLLVFAASIYIIRSTNQRRRYHAILQTYGLKSLQFGKLIFLEILFLSSLAWIISLIIISPIFKILFSSLIQSGVNLKVPHPNPRANPLVSVLPVILIFIISLINFFYSTQKYKKLVPGELLKTE